MAKDHRVPEGEAGSLITSRVLAGIVACALALDGCASRATPADVAGFTPAGRFAERVRVLDLHPGVTATIVAPAAFDPARPAELILYALPNGNTTAETMGRAPNDSATWRYDIQHIAAQTRALRAASPDLSQAVVVYLEAEGRSWPQWRARQGYPRANARIVSIVDQLRAAIGNPASLAVTLTGHSGGGSFMFGFIEAHETLPGWLTRIAFLDANYNFEPRHGETIGRWLRDDVRRTLVVLAYDDRNIMLDGRRVVSDSGGTWRASQRMINYLREPFALAADSLGAFRRFSHPQIEILLHPNPANRILHTEMIGEMNGYMHAMLARRPGYATPVLGAPRAYMAWAEPALSLPAPAPPAIPARAAGAMTGSAFLRSVATLTRDEREAAIRRELFAGNVPRFLRALRTVEVAVTGPDSARRTIAYEVMPDYLAIGSDEDFARIPMMPQTAQAFCDAFGFVLPTRKMVDDIWAAAGTHLDPRPLTQERESPLTFLQHDGIIRAQLDSARAPLGAFVAGHKKDVVVSNVLQARADRVAIYGWHYPAGKPIQPLYAGHVDWYVDYSHGIRPVRRMMRVDGTAMPFERIVGDSALAFLLSDEGAIAAPRYIGR